MKTLKSLLFLIPFVIVSLFILSILNDIVYQIAFLYWFFSVSGFGVYVATQERRLQKQCEKIEMEMFLEENDKALKKVKK